MLSLARAEEKVPGIRCAQENAIFVCFPVTFAKVPPLAVTFRCFCGYFCNFPTFSEKFVSAWQRKSFWLPAPRIHLSPPLSLFSKYAPIVLLPPPLKLFFSSRFCSQRQSGQLDQIFAVWREMTIIAGPFIFVNDKGGGKGYILIIFLARCHENDYWLVSYPEQSAREVKNVVKFSFLY